MNRKFNNIKVGDIFHTNQGCNVRVIRIVNSKNIDIEYIDNFGYITTTSLQHLNSGSLKNPYYPTVFNIGYIGVGQYIASVSGRNTIQYDAWRNMLRRCYCPSYQSSQPSYIGCVVDPIWHNFQTFAGWYCNHPNYNKGYHLDKDIIIEGNRIYGPQYCTLVPEVINNLFREHGERSKNRELPIGIYKHGDKFQVEYNGTYYGTCNTVEEATQKYIDCKRNYILQILYQYKYNLDADVYYAMYALAHSI